MSEQLFRDVLNALISAAEDHRFKAREAGLETDHDMWSVVAGLLDNARQRMRK